MKQPQFESSHQKHNPLSFKVFRKKFTLFTRDCEDDASRLSWLQSSCKGNAYHLISKLSISNDNFKVAEDVLCNHYMNSDRIEDQLLSSIANFTIPKPNGDFSNFSSSMISLQVHLEEIKN
jgi:hypothetical protein